MKSFLILLLSVCSLSLRAQTTLVPVGQSASNSPMEFSSHAYNLEDHWVVFPKNEKTGKYAFGFVYLDMTAGYTFDLEGQFGVDDQGHVHPDSTGHVKVAFYKVRLAPNTKLVYSLPDNMLKDLGVTQVPAWLAAYKHGNPDKNSVASKVLYGKHLNSAGGAAEALVYLESAYKTEPHAAGLEFELTYSYNELKQYNQAITVLNAAIANAPANPMFYRELGYAYMCNNDIDNAINTYLKGIEIAGVTNNESKSEMAWNLAVVYRDKKNNIDEFKKWGKMAKDLAAENSVMAQRLKNVIF